MAPTQAAEMSLCCAGGLLPLIISNLGIINADVLLALNLATLKESIVIAQHQTACS
jgi:hypothetical protein